MSRPEPAGAGTAEMIAGEMVAKAKPWFDGTSDDDARKRRALTKAIRNAITAAESRAMERCAKIAERGWPHVPLVAVTDEITKAIAARIRSSISPPGEEE